MYRCYCDELGDCFDCATRRNRADYDLRYPMSTKTTKQLTGTLTKDEVVQAIKDYVGKQFSGLTATEVTLTDGGAAFKVEAGRSTVTYDNNYR